MNTTTEKAVIAFRILNNAKIGKMKDGDKFNIVRIMKELKPVATGYDDFVKDATEKLKPEGFDSIEPKLRNQEKLSNEEQALVDKFNADVTKCVESELKKEHEFNFVPLSEEGFKGLLSSNDFSVAEIMSLYEVIGE